MIITLTPTSQLIRPSIFGLIPSPWPLPGWLTLSQALTHRSARLTSLLRDYILRDYIHCQPVIESLSGLSLGYLWGAYGGISEVSLGCLWVFSRVYLGCLRRVSGSTCGSMVISVWFF